ncbi:hypothetical protein QBC39DRAFT_23109 [Podospora conica]|nr:hypothetical protein QBC39DRAFT_23109 [Schizothecium conicum]
MCTMSQRSFSSSFPITMRDGMVLANEHVPIHDRDLGHASWALSTSLDPEDSIGLVGITNAFAGQSPHHCHFTCTAAPDHHHHHHHAGRRVAQLQGFGDGVQGGGRGDEGGGGVVVSRVRQTEPPDSVTAVCCGRYSICCSGPGASFLPQSQPGFHLTVTLSRQLGPASITATTPSLRPSPSAPSAPSPCGRVVSTSGWVRW